jgi:hypothetical protein
MMEFEDEVQSVDIAVFNKIWAKGVKVYFSSVDAVYMESEREDINKLAR